MNESLKHYFKNDEIAASVWLGKYAAEGEKTPDDMHNRLAQEFARKQFGFLKYELTENDKINLLSNYGKKKYKYYQNFENPDELLKYITGEFYYLFYQFKYIVPQGSVMSMLGIKDKIGSISNCFVIGQPEDSYGGILLKDQELVQLMKRRAGVGLDISLLRPENSPVTNAAKTSTGAHSFMHRFSNSTREVAQGGRRGALMITINVHHPDVLKFIGIKADRTQVTGANISVSITDEFFDALKKNKDYPLIFNNQIVNNISAQKVYDFIVHNAWENAEPGQLFIDRHWDYSPDSVYSEYRGITTNPCGEIFMGAYDACRLICLNFLSFVTNPFTKDAKIDFVKLYEYSYKQQILADLLVDLELEQIDKIILKIGLDDPEEFETKQNEYNLWKKVKLVTASSRRTGSGFTALGDTLAALNLHYDSNEALQITEKIMLTKFQGELDATIDLSIMRGSFTGFDPKKEFYYDIEDGVTYCTGIGQNSFFNFLSKTFPEETRKMIKYGRRNVSWSTVAPTGSVSILTQTTSGIEPLFKPFYIRRKKVNPNEKNVRIDFVDQSGDSWTEYPIIHRQFINWYLINNPETTEEVLLNKTEKELLEIFKTSPWFNSTAEDIDWKKRIDLQAIVQKYTTHSISSTINLPKTITKEEVKDIYLYAYEKNLKGITIYRDGSRTGVLIDSNSTSDEFKQYDAPKRPKILPCEVYETIRLDQKYLIIVGLYQEKPYEIFTFKWNEKNKVGSGTITKVKKNQYKLEIDNFVIENIKDYITSEEAIITRLVSGMLRHGGNIKFVVEQLDKATGDFQSLGKVLVRILKKYISEGEIATGVLCETCGSDSIIYEEGCQKCTSCGTSKC